MPDPQTLFNMPLRHLRGHDYKLHNRHVKTEVKRNFFTSRVITPWNNLSQDIVGVTSGTSFRNRLRAVPKWQSSLWAKGESLIDFYSEYKEEQPDGSLMTTDPYAKYPGVEIVRTEACRYTSHIVLQDCLWPCWNTYSSIHPPSGQNDQNYALHALHTNTHYSKLLQILFLSISNCTVEQTRCPGCYVPGPEFFQVHCMQPSSLRAIDYETLFLPAFNFFAN